MQVHSSINAIKDTDYLSSYLIIRVNVGQEINSVTTTAAGKIYKQSLYDKMSHEIFKKLKKITKSKNIVIDFAIVDDYYFDNNYEHSINCCKIIMVGDQKKNSVTTATGTK